MHGKEQRCTTFDNRCHPVRRTVCEIAVLQRLEHPVMEAEVRNAKVSHKSRLIEQRIRRPSEAKEQG